MFTYLSFLDPQHAQPKPCQIDTIPSSVYHIIILRSWEKSGALTWQLAGLTTVPPGRPTGQMPILAPNFFWVTWYGLLGLTRARKLPVTYGLPIF